MKELKIHIPDQCWECGMYDVISKGQELECQVTLDTINPRGLDNPDYKCPHKEDFGE